MKKAYHIREADPEDVPALVDFLIRLDAHVAGVKPEILALTDRGEAQLYSRIRSFVEDPGKLIVVAVAPDGELAGMGNIHIWQYDDVWVNPERQGLRAGYIDDVWVEPEHRGAGLARRIVAALVEFAETEKINEISLEYAMYNPEAEAFWAKLGFRPSGVRASAWLADVRERLGPPVKGRRARSKAGKKGGGTNRG